MTSLTLRDQAFSIRVLQDVEVASQSLPTLAPGVRLGMTVGANKIKIEEALMRELGRMNTLLFVQGFSYQFAYSGFLVVFFFLSDLFSPIVSLAIFLIFCQCVF